MSCEKQSGPRAIFRGAAIALLLSAIAGPSLGAELSVRPGYHTLSMSRLADGRGDITDAGTPAFAYNDGFWDVRHQWHPWISDEEMQNFRALGGVKIHPWNHDRDSDFGWPRH